MDDLTEKRELEGFMKVIRLLIIGCFILSVVQVPCHAIDPSVFWGTWETESEDLPIKILIKGRKTISLDINGKHVEDVEFEYIYSKLNVALPFLCLYAKEGEVEHSIYLTIGNNEGSHKLNRLKGFYEFGELLYLNKKTGDDHGGDMRISIYPLELVREPKK